VHACKPFCALLCSESGRLRLPRASTIDGAPEPSMASSSLSRAHACLLRCTVVAARLVRRCTRVGTGYPRRVRLADRTRHVGCCGIPAPGTGTDHSSLATNPPPLFRPGNRSRDLALSNRVTIDRPGNGKFVPSIVFLGFGKTAVRDPPKKNARARRFDLVLIAAGFRCV
jgi:hypothetical protein